MSCLAGADPVEGLQVSDRLLRRARQQPPDGLEELPTEMRGRLRRGIQQPVGPFIHERRGNCRQGKPNNQGGCQGQVGGRACLAEGAEAES
jgi:hypothetical protein